MYTPKTLQEAIIYFSEFKNCHDFMISMRWPDGVVRCPRCGSEDVVYMEKSRLYFCRAKHAKAKFSLKVGTIFEDSPLGLDKWLCAVWLLSNCKNGISSYELARALGITQKAAWHVLHRVREAMTETSGQIGGNAPVECDETFVGGLAKNMHKRKRIGISMHEGNNKTIVLGMLERGGEVRASVIGNRRHKATSGLC